MCFLFLYLVFYPSDEADGDKKKKDKKKKKAEKEEKEKKKGPSKATVKAMQEALAKMKEVGHAGKFICRALTWASLIHMHNSNCFAGGGANQEGGGGATEEIGGAREAAAGAGTPALLSRWCHLKPNGDLWPLKMFC